MPPYTTNVLQLYTHPLKLQRDTETRNVNTRNTHGLRPKPRLAPALLALHDMRHQKRKAERRGDG